jgi:hypothetical protein
VLEFIKNLLKPAHYLLLNERATMFNLKKGDVIIGKRTGNRRKVLGVSGEAIFVTKRNDFDRAETGYFTNLELTKLNYRMETDADRSKKVTLAEIAEAFNTTVDRLEIVDESHD